LSGEEGNRERYGTTGNGKKIKGLMVLDSGSRKTIGVIRVWKKKEGIKRITDAPRQRRDEWGEKGIHEWIRKYFWEEKGV